METHDGCVILTDPVWRCRGGPIAWTLVATRYAFSTDRRTGMEVGAMGSMHGNRPGIRHCRMKKVGLVRRPVLGALAGVLSLALVLAACGNEQGGGGTSGGTTAHKIKLVAASYSDKTQGYWQDLISLGSADVMVL
jgi:hypothetical protein